MAYAFNPFTGTFTPSPTFPGLLVIAAGKTVTINQSLTLAGTDSTTMTFPSTSATIARTDAAQTFTGSQTIAALVGPVTITEAVGSSGLTITGATQTSSFPALNVTQTWNASGTTFTALKLNVTNTASASGSLLQDWQLGGTSVASMDKTGALHVLNGATNGLFFGATDGLRYNSTSDSGYIRFIVAGGGEWAWVGTNFIASSTSFFGWAPGAISAASVDLKLFRAAAATLQMGADVNGAAVAQTMQAANGITGTDKTGGNFTSRSGAGTGAGAVSSWIVQTPTVTTSGTTAQAQATRLTINSAGATFAAGITLLGGATLLTTSSALTDGAGASAGTLGNAPAIGNPTKWIGINDNGTTRYIPAW